MLRRHVRLPATCASRRLIAKPTQPAQSARPVQGLRGGTPVAMTM
jgi:hypothetical protein